VGPNPFLGIIYHWIGGFASATNFIPFRGIRRWSWEIYWIIQAFAAWIVAPLLFAIIFVPHLFGILHEAPASSIHYAFAWGVLWGIGSITFGLAIRYLGLALGYAIALGLSTAFGTLVPPIYDGSIQTIFHETSGHIILAGVTLCLIAVAINGAAGLSKEREVTDEDKGEAGETDFSFTKGFTAAIIAGIMSACFAFALTSGAPIGAIAKRELLTHNRLDLWQNLPTLIVILCGGFLTNFIWSAILILKNKSVRQFAGEPGSNPMRATHASGYTLIDFDPLDVSTHDRLSQRTLTSNYILASLAGVFWYLQFFFFSIGQEKMGKYDFSSWTLHMASIILFAALWGFALKEWRATSWRTKTLVITGILLLILSTIVIGYGNYLKAHSNPTIFN
jgi:L-rhamnose-H+ transport protein